MQVVMVVVLLVALAVVVAVPVVLVIAAFATIRALVRPGGRRAAAGAGLALVLVLVAAGLSLTVGVLSAYSDTACSDVARRTGRDEEGGGWEQSAGLWPPGLRCRFHSRAGEVSTYRAGWGPVGFGVVSSALFGASMAALVVGRARRQPQMRSRTDE